MTNRGLLQGALQALASFFVAHGLVALAATLQVRFGSSDFPDTSWQQAIFQQQLVRALSDCVLGLLVFWLARRLSAFVFVLGNPVNAQGPVRIVALAAAGFGFLITGVQGTSFILLTGLLETESAGSATRSQAWMYLGQGMRAGLGFAMVLAARMLAGRVAVGPVSSDAPGARSPTGTALRLTGVFLLGGALLNLVMTFVWRAQVDEARLAGPLVFVIGFAVLGFLLFWQGQRLAVRLARPRPAGEEPALAHGVVRHLGFGLAGWYAATLGVLYLTSMAFGTRAQADAGFSSATPSSTAPLIATSYLVLSLVLLAGPRRLARAVRGIRVDTPPFDATTLPSRDVVLGAFAGGGVYMILRYGVPYLASLLSSGELTAWHLEGGGGFFLGGGLLGVVLLVAARQSRFRESRSLLLAVEVGALAGLIAMVTSSIHMIADVMLHTAGGGRDTTSILGRVLGVLIIFGAPIATIVWAQAKARHRKVIDAETFE